MRNVAGLEFYSRPYRSVDAGHLGFDIGHDDVIEALLVVAVADAELCGSEVSERQGEPRVLNAFVGRVGRLEIAGVIVVAVAFSLQGAARGQRGLAEQPHPKAQVAASSRDLVQRNGYPVRSDSHVRYRKRVCV